MTENADVMGDKIRESFGTLLEYVEKGAGFAAEQAPLVAQELIRWGFWNHAIGAVTALATAVVLGFAVKRYFPVIAAECRKDILDQSIEIQLFGGLAVAVATITAGISTGVAVGHVKMLVMSQVAPRVFLIEKIRDALN